MHLSHQPDVRFSKDKSPYKNNFGAYINKGGKKSIYAGYYFHCQPGQSFTVAVLATTGTRDEKAETGN
jgi:uncharacterized protein (DUF2461 family)